VVETPTLTRKPSVAPLLRVRNTSAIPMRAIVRKAPDWLIFSGSTSIAAESVTLLRPAVTGEAPAGEHRVEVGLEITNLHTAPNRNLMVTLPLTIVVQR
jgi:hypothetical protein